MVKNVDNLLSETVKVRILPQANDSVDNRLLFFFITRQLSHEVGITVSIYATIQFVNSPMLTTAC